jgi:hypothetical protein
MRTTIKTVTALAVAFVLTTQISLIVFPSNTPAIRPQLGTYLTLRLQSMWSDGSSYIASLFNKNDAAMIAAYQEKLQKKQDQLAGVAFKQLSKGVYAKDEGNTHSLVEIRLNEIEFIEHTFTVNGKQIVINVPKDQELPSQQVLEKMYGN